MKTLETRWEIWTYDVLGNEADGYQVNDRHCQHREYPIDCTVETCNAGREGEFETAYPGDADIRAALDIRDGVELELDGDDLSIYVSDDGGYPIGEMHCVSHKSLSPIA